MKLFKVERTDDPSWDEYDAMIVCCEDEETARNMSPDTGEPMTEKEWNEQFSFWCKSPTDLKVEYLGEAADHVEKGVVLDSFNAG